MNFHEGLISKEDNACTSVSYNHLKPQLENHEILWEDLVKKFYY